MTRIYRDHWKNINATTEIDIPELGERQFMRINTSKGSSGYLSTMVSVNERNEYGYTHAMFRDFCKTVQREKVRATEKAVLAQHAAALQQIEQIKAEAIAHYNEVTA